MQIFVTPKDGFAPLAPIVMLGSVWSAEWMQVIVSGGCCYVLINSSLI
jgi:hypothetical protein